MTHIKKIAVFDLDGTIYIGNSHIEFLCYVYKTTLFKNFLYKLIAHIFPKMHSNIIWWLYNRNKGKVCDFSLPYNSKVLHLLKEKKEEGYFPLIISNAPIELVENAAKDLKLNFLRAEIGKKSKELNKKYQYEQLFVCTDNKTDVDLLRIADKSVVIRNKRDRDFWKKQSFISCVFWEN